MQKEDIWNFYKIFKIKDMGWTSITNEIPLSQLKILKKEGKRIEQFLISKDVIFLPKKRYIPLEDILKLQIRRGQMNTTNCCGMSFPVYALVVFPSGAKPEKLLFEKRKNALRAAELLIFFRESIVLEEYIPPYKKV